MEKKKVLFIEDDSLIVKIYTTRLELEGIEVSSAEDGEIAMQMYRQKEPDLIVLDLMLPKVSGLEILKQIRQENKSIPIIVYSVLSDREKIEEMKANGANEYFVKPDIHPRQMVERIKSYLA